MNAEQDAREPSAEQIAESRRLAEQYGHMVYGRALAMIIAHVRQQAERAALEKAANVCEERGDRSIKGANETWGHAIADFHVAADAEYTCMRAIRALMQPEQKGKG